MPAPVRNGRAGGDRGAGQGRGGGDLSGDGRPAILQAELPYALIGMVTDYDCWREGEAVDVAEVVGQMQANGALARAMVLNFIAALPEVREPSPIDTALDDAVITAPDEHDPALMAKLDAVAGRLFG